MQCRPEYDMQVVGQNLKRLREAKNLSVEDVREYLCLGSVQAVYKYEKGKSYPQADTMFALMELYEANLYDIVLRKEEGQKPSSFIYFIRNCCRVVRKVLCLHGYLTTAAIT